MFKIIVRKASFLNLFVGGDAVVRKSISLGDLTGGVFSTNAKVKAEVADDNTVTLSFLLQNNGNVVQNVALSGMIYNFLGFQKPFDAGTKKLMPGESTLVSINAGILPSYK
ncbi:TPA: hypothetical protein DEP21_05370 [Patescibacteria group bacterium]|nr:hypothetical protein [Candidatus Gracilibacteria bacterium]